MFVDDRDAIAYGRHTQTREEATVFRYVREVADLPYVEAFRLLHLLFCEGLAPEKPDVMASLEKIVMDRGWEKNGHYFINRSMYTIRNPWSVSGKRTGEFQQLLDDLRQRISCESGTARRVRSLRPKFASYFDSTQYSALLRSLERLEEETNAQRAHKKAVLVDDRFRDMFFLHEPLATSPDIDDSERNAFSRSVASDAWKFRNKLCECLKTRLVPADLRPEVFGGEEAFLEFAEHMDPIRHGSLWTTSLKFREKARSMKMNEVCDQLIANLMSSLDSASDVSWLVRRPVSQVVKQFRAEVSTQHFNFVSLTTLCRRLFGTLIIESESRRQNVFVLQRMLTDHGAAKVAEMLLRITFLVPTVHYALERQLAIVFHLNKDNPIHEASWLVNLLDHLKVGLAMNVQHLYGLKLNGV